MDQVEEVKKKADIVEIIAEHVPLKRAGRNFRGLCPFHSEKTPSFNVSPELQIYKCFGCGEAGDVLSFLMEFEKIDFPQALKLLADRYGIKLIPLKGFSTYAEKEEIYAVNFVTAEFYHYLLIEHKIGESARLYLKNRGIGDETIKTFKLGVAPEKIDATFSFLTQKRGYKPEILEKAGIVGSKNGRFYDRFRGRITFPLYDHFGNILGFSGRVTEDRGDLAKYINSPETLVYKKGQTLFGLNVTKNDIKKEGLAVIVEGEFDLLSSWQAGVKNVVAIKGSAFTDSQAGLLSRFTQKIILALDSDFAGDQASHRGLEILQRAGLEVKVVSLGTKDPDEAARSDPEGYKKQLDQAEGVYDFLINSALKRHDASSTEGKAKISRELSPVIGAIEDEIVRAHCVKRVAQSLNVPEEAVAREVAKFVRRGVPEQFSQPAAERLGRAEILEENLLAFIFGKFPALLLDGQYTGLIKNPARRKLVEHFRDLYKEDPAKFIPSEFSETLSPELRTAFASIMLVDLDMDNPEAVRANVDNLARELKVEATREKIKLLTEQIRSLESKGDESAIKELEVNLTQETRHLASLEPKFS